MSECESSIRTNKREKKETKVGINEKKKLFQNKTTSATKRKKQRERGRKELTVIRKTERLHETFSFGWSNSIEIKGIFEAANNLKCKNRVHRTCLFADCLGTFGLSQILPKWVQKLKKNIIVVVCCFFPHSSNICSNGFEVIGNCALLRTLQCDNDFCDFHLFFSSFVLFLLSLLEKSCLFIKVLALKTTFVKCPSPCLYKRASSNGCEIRLVVKFRTQRINWWKHPHLVRLCKVSSLVFLPVLFVFSIRSVLVFKSTLKADFTCSANRKTKSGGRKRTEPQNLVQ